MRKFLHAVVWLLAAAPAAAACPIADAKVALHDFPPFYYPDSNGQPAGELVALLDGAMRELGCQWSGQFYPVPRLLSKIANGSVDAAMIIRHPMLEGRAHYGNIALGELTLKLYRQPDLPELPSLAAVPKGARVIVRRGYGYHGYIEQLLGQGSRATLVFADSHRQSVEMLQHRQGDYLLNYEGPSQHYLNLMGLYHVEGNAIASWPIYLVLSERLSRGEEIINTLDGIIEQLRLKPQ